MSKTLKELNDKIEELDAATDELWDIKDEHSKKIDELKKEQSESFDELHDMMTSYDDDINKISFHEQKIEALLRRVKNLEQKLNESKQSENNLVRYLKLSVKVLIVSSFFAYFSSKLLFDRIWNFDFSNIWNGALALFLSLLMTWMFSAWFLHLTDRLFDKFSNK
jgi:hypothetical protein